MCYFTRLMLIESSFKHFDQTLKLQTLSTIALQITAALP